MRFFTLALACLFSASTLSAAPITDFDGDGLDDLVGFSINADTSISWSVRSSKTSEISDLGLLGKNGDHLAPGHWRNASAAERVIVSKLPDDTISWALEGGESFIFGAAGNLLMTGADYDNNGALDATILERKDGQLLWKIRVNPFNSSPAGGTELTTITFGASTDRPFIANLDGDGDWLGVYLADETGLKYYNPRNAEVREFPLDPALSLDNPPVPVKNDQGKDDLAFVEQVGPQNLVNILTTAGQPLRKLRIRSDGAPVTGNFDAGDVAGELGLKNAAGAVLYNPTSKKRSTVTLGPVSLVDHFNVASFSGSSDAPGFDQCSVLNSRDGNKFGFTWKPNSDTTFFAVAVLPGSLFGKVRKVEVYSSLGQFIKQLTYSGCGNPDKNGMRCNHKDYSLTGRSYKKQFGAIALKVFMKDGSCGVYHISNPARRTD